MVNAAVQGARPVEHRQNERAQTEGLQTLCTTPTDVLWRAPWGQFLAFDVGDQGLSPNCLLEVHRGRRLAHTTNGPQLALQEADLAGVHAVRLRAFVPSVVQGLLVAPPMPSVQILVPQVVAKVRVPEIGDEHHASLVPIVDDLMLEAVVKDQAAADLPLPPLRADSDTRCRVGHIEGQVDADPGIRRSAVRPDARAAGKPREDQRAAYLCCDFWAAILNQLYGLRAAHAIHGVPLAVFHQLEVCPITLQDQRLVRDRGPTPTFCPIAQGAILTQDCREGRLQLEGGRHVSHAPEGTRPQTGHIQIVGPLHGVLPHSS
mmetsp:Transcript_20261/g.53510  ORF Transcript_20261/g.53510 Transcript_20261/m.53510 type:complete len:318 (-) Transcript_20261:159-1112(-)